MHQQFRFCKKKIKLSLTVLVVLKALKTFFEKRYILPSDNVNVVPFPRSVWNCTVQLMALAKSRIR